MLQKLLDLAPQQTFLVRGNAEFYDAFLMAGARISSALLTRKAPQLTIEEAGFIAEFATMGGYEKTIGIFYFTSYSAGAAEVLLKALEEPHKHAIVVIITPYPYSFPQTLRSRMRLVEPISERALIKISKATLRKEGEALSGSTDDAALRRAATLTFLDSIEAVAHAEKNIGLARSLYMAKHFLLAANMPPKQVLEFVLSTQL